MIDAHHHLWNYTDAEFGWIESDTIRRDFRAPELDTLLTENGVSGAVAVQARTSLEENDFLLAEAATSQTIKAVVGWVDLKSPEAGAQIDQYAGNPLFKGLREITQGAPDQDFLDHPDFHRGIREITARGLSYDVLIFQDQIASATRFIDQHPNQRFVLDHAAKPEIRTAAYPDTWESQLREMAKRDHLVCKISGLVTEVRDASWDNALMARYFDVLLDAFGPDRLMFGSDWPVSLLASSYTRWKDCVTQHLSQLSQDEQSAIFTKTATRFYQL
ncbi:amidohydrolase family protein [Rubritalea tangerina]|uniref:Amidohydrolase family protein n=1 Tax=Rubritalea tangerina TaxID=430798 RepID=A0ABW4Z876_9BACT